jgi:hypothetical protein
MSLFSLTPKNYKNHSTLCASHLFICIYCNTGEEFRCIWEHTESVLTWIGMGDNQKFVVSGKATDVRPEHRSLVAFSRAGCCVTTSRDALALSQPWISPVKNVSQHVGRPIPKRNLIFANCSNKIAVSELNGTLGEIELTIHCWETTWLPPVRLRCGIRCPLALPILICTLVVHPWNCANSTGHMKWHHYPVIHMRRISLKSRCWTHFTSHRARMTQSDSLL